MYLVGTKKNFFVNNTSLELRKVPLDKNNICSINEHFSKFGLITNLQVCYKGEPDAAVVTFATPQQAQAAYRCTEPVFNNRFVRIFFHNPDAESAPSSDRGGDRRMSVKERLGTIIPPASKLTLNNKKKDADIFKVPLVLVLRSYVLNCFVEFERNSALLRWGLTFNRLVFQKPCSTRRPKSRNLIRRH